VVAIPLWRTVTSAPQGSAIAESKSPPQLRILRRPRVDRIVYIFITVKDGSQLKKPRSYVVRKKRQLRAPSVIACTRDLDDRSLGGGEVHHCFGPIAALARRGAPGRSPGRRRSQGEVEPRGSANRTGKNITNARHTGLLSRNGVTVVVPIISPYVHMRDAARAELPSFVEV